MLIARKFLFEDLILLCGKPKTLQPSVNIWKSRKHFCLFLLASVPLQLHNAEAPQPRVSLSSAVYGEIWGMVMGQSWEGQEHGSATCTVELKLHVSRNAWLLLCKQGKVQKMPSVRGEK